MPSKKREIVLDGYCFVGFAHRITVMSKGNMDEEELAAIVKLYEEHYKSSREGGVLHGGKWQWCLNSEECRKAVYAPIAEIEKSQGRIFCSGHCRNKKAKVKRAIKYPGKEELKRLIREHKGHLSSMINSLKEQGITIPYTAMLSKLIREDEELDGLAQELRQTRTREAKQARKPRKVKERTVKHPGNERLSQLIIEHDAYLTPISKSLLKEDGIKASTGLISIWITGNIELKRLAKEKRKARKEITSSAERPAAKKETEDLPTAIIKKEKLPLTKEETEVLSAYQEGDSVQVLVSKTKKPEGRIDVIVTSILAKCVLAKGDLTTLGEAKEILLESQQELANR